MDTKPAWLPVYNAQAHIRSRYRQIYNDTLGKSVQSRSTPYYINPNTDTEKQKQVLECIILVHNYWTQIVGHNQILTVFVPKYERVINIHSYDRIRKYYLQPGDCDTDNEAEQMQENFDDGGEDDIYSITLGFWLK